MATGGEPGRIHPEVTRRNAYRYLIYDKHHGRGGPDVARWALDLDDAEEFGIFDRADWLELSDEAGNLYGLRSGADGGILDLGTMRQQVAKFPHAGPNQPWHGFPLGPLNESGRPHPPNRPLPKDVLLAMEVSGLLNRAQRKRLEKGKFL